MAQQQALVTMVTHYQRMFGVKWVGGVYASMSHVAMTLEETQNILKTIKEILHLGELMLPLIIIVLSLKC